MSAPINPLDAWLADVVQALGVSAEALDRDVVLDLTRDVAHQVGRPAAPLTAFLVGLRAGQHGGDEGAVTDAVARVRALITTTE